MARKRQSRSKSTRNRRWLHKPRDRMSRRFTRGGVTQVRLSEVPAIVAGSETRVTADILAPLVALVAERCPTDEDRLGPSAKNLASCGVAAWTALKRRDEPDEARAFHETGFARASAALRQAMMTEAESG